MIEIEKGVPMPAARSGIRARKYPIKEMQIGDSFLIDKVKRTSVYKGFRDQGMKCAVRVEGDKVRVWRIE